MLYSLRGRVYFKLRYSFGRQLFVYPYYDEIIELYILMNMFDLSFLSLFYWKLTNLFGNPSIEFRSFLLFTNWLLSLKASEFLSLGTEGLYKTKD